MSEPVTPPLLWFIFSGLEYTDSLDGWDEMADTQGFHILYTLHKLIMVYMLYWISLVFTPD